MLRKAGIAAFVASAIILAAAYSARAQTASADDTARFLAGMPPSGASPLVPLTQDPAWQQHLRPPISLECGTYATRPDRLIQPKILGRKPISAVGGSNRACNWGQTTPKDRKNGTSGAW